MYTISRNFARCNISQYFAIFYFIEEETDQFPTEILENLEKSAILIQIHFRHKRVYARKLMND